MRFTGQLKHGIVQPIAVNFRMDRRCWARWALYVFLACLVLGGIALALITQKEALRDAALAYVVPEDWIQAAGFLAERFLKVQQKELLVNGLVGASLLVVGLLLFRVKEWLSVAVEAREQLTSEPHREFPIWFQAFEEIKLLLLYITVFMSLFWLGYPPDPIRRAIASTLSYAFLFLTWSIDFGAPIMQRHRIRYSQVIKVLLRNPVATLGFGAIFATPSIVAGQIAAHSTNVSPGVTVALVFGINVVAFGCAAVGGTWFGGKLLDDARQTPRSGPVVRGLAWLILLGSLGANLFVFGSLAMSVHHKSQMLKLRPSVVWSTVGFTRPSVLGLLKGKVTLGVHIDMRLENPTDVDVEIEENRLELHHRKELMATAKLAPMKVPAHKTVTQRIDFRVALKAKALLKGLDLLNDAYSLTLFLRITDALDDFPIYVRKQP